MPLASLAKNQSATAIQGTVVQFTSDPLPLGAANYGQFSLNIESMFSSAGGTSLIWEIEGSNDGVNFQPIAGATDTRTTVGLTEVGSELHFPFLRARYSFTAGASGGDWGAIVFDFRVNLLCK